MRISEYINMYLTTISSSAPKNVFLSCRKQDFLIVNFLLQGKFIVVKQCVI